MRYLVAWTERGQSLLQVQEVVGTIAQAEALGENLLHTAPTRVVLIAPISVEMTAEPVIKRATVNA